LINGSLYVDIKIMAPDLNDGQEMRQEKWTRLNISRMQVYTMKNTGGLIKAACSNKPHGKGFALGAIVVGCF